ncbi:MAG: hypothetical protein ABII06_04125 [Pseudomonadota bacterium]
MGRELKIFDRPENVKRLLRGFYIFLVLLLVVDFFISKHGYFPLEEYPDFFAVYGFAACVLLIFIAKVLRLFLKREENYYE